VIEKRYKFARVNELTGAFVIGVVALVIAGAVFTGHSQRWFEKKFKLDVLLPEQGALGLRRGDELFILGVSAGKVDDIIVAENGRMTARMKIRRDFERFVRSDSTASIKKVFGVAGDSFMEISRGTGRPLAANKPSITCLESEDSLGRMEKMLADLQSQLLPVVKKAGVTLDEWTRLGGDLKKHGEQLRDFIGRLDTLAAGIEAGRGTAGALLTQSTLSDDAHRLLAEAHDAFIDLRGTVTNINAAVANVENGTARLPELTGALADEAKDIPGLVKQTQTSMHELERLIEALQKHWIVRKYMDKTEPPPSSRPDQGLPKKNSKSVRSPKDSAR
jgi:phospholipid/cholesterol/gamma-HCH transport system substrate-binding protein